MAGAQGVAFDLRPDVAEGLGLFNVDLDLGLLGLLLLGL